MVMDVQLPASETLGQRWEGRGHTLMGQIRQFQICWVKCYQGFCRYIFWRWTGFLVSANFVKWMNSTRIYTTPVDQCGVNWFLWFRYVFGGKMKDPHLLSWYCLSSRGGAVHIGGNSLQIGCNDHPAVVRVSDRLQGSSDMPPRVNIGQERYHFRRRGGGVFTELKFVVWQVKVHNFNKLLKLTAVWMLMTPRMAYGTLVDHN